MIAPELVQFARNAIYRNGVMIVRTPTGIGVGWNHPFERPPAGPWTVEVYYRGRLLKTDFVSPLAPWRDYFGNGIDHLACVVLVKDGETLLAELGLPPGEYIDPFMVRNGVPQQHVTESYVSVPPALTITDEVGAVWTVGLATATPDQSPRGEFAFDVLRDGEPAGVIASRIERRNGKVRAFTKRGWLVWNGRAFL